MDLASSPPPRVTVVVVVCRVGHWALGLEAGVEADGKDLPPRKCLVLPRQASVHAVAFSEVSLAFAAGSLATVYGMGNRHNCEWTERPAFEVVADLIDHEVRYDVRADEARARDSASQQTNCQ